ncbi:VWA domain-containing protein [Corynebacterium durum]|uniref:VWA domain-containing protein n=1 Tax=Corynebacterium durum TaxID=61592 RepID=UPI0028E7FC3A|nr:VWA domain-containing protein [Corynebacterium durum]
MPHTGPGRMRVGVAALTTACTLIGMHAPLASSAEPSSEHPDTALIIDASGSMWAPDGSGELRTNTANRVAHTLLGELPGDQQLALLTYGTGTGNSDEEKEAGCKDVQTLVPLGGSRDEIAAQIDGLVASGYTPIGPALLAAEKTLDTKKTEKNKRHIVLVSDGIDTCAPPEMAEVARDIHKRNSNVTIDVVGLNADETVSEQLKELAAAGGGTYADATDEASVSALVTALSAQGAAAASDTGKSDKKDADKKDSGDHDGHKHDGDDKDAHKHDGHKHEGDKSEDKSVDKSAEKPAEKSSESKANGEPSKAETSKSDEKSAEKSEEHKAEKSKAETPKSDEKSETKTEDKKSTENSTTAKASESSEAASATQTAAKDMKGTNKADGAPTLAVGTTRDGRIHQQLFTDSLPAVSGDSKDQERHWSVTLKEGQQLNVGFLIPTPEGNVSAKGKELTVTPELLNPKGKACVATSEKVKVDGNFTGAQSASLLSKEIKKGTDCPPGKYDLVLKRTGELAADKDLPIRISTWAVPQVDDAKLPQSSSKPKIADLPLGDVAGELPTNTNVAAAPSVKAGTYTAALKPGETQWFRVPVKDGQRLQMHLEAQAAGKNDHSISWQAFSPLYNHLSATTDGGADGTDRSEGNVVLNADEATSATFATEPIRWANMKKAGAVNTSFLAGEQLVAVRHNAPADAGSEPVNVTLAVASTGEGEHGPDLAKYSASNNSNEHSSQWTGVWWLFLLLFVIGILATWLSPRSKKAKETSEE